MDVDSSLSGSKFGLVLAPVPPLAITAWALLSMSGLPLGSWATVICGSIALIAIWLAHEPVAVYQYNRQGSPTKVPEGLTQFTVGYMRFHAKRAGWPAMPFIIGTLGLVAVLGASWLALMLGALWDLGTSATPR